MESLLPTLEQQRRVRKSLTQWRSAGKPSAFRGSAGIIDFQWSRAPIEEESTAMTGQTNGRKRHLRRYLGAPSEHQVHTNIGEREEENGCCPNSKGTSKDLIWADMGYNGPKFANWIQTETGATVEIVKLQIQTRRGNASTTAKTRRIQILTSDEWKKKFCLARKGSKAQLVSPW